MEIQLRVRVRVGEGEGEGEGDLALLLACVTRTPTCHSGLKPGGESAQRRKAGE